MADIDCPSSSSKCAIAIERNPDSSSPQCLFLGNGQGLTCEPERMPSQHWLLRWSTAKHWTTPQGVGLALVLLLLFAIILTKLGYIGDHERHPLMSHFAGHQKVQPSQLHGIAPFVKQCPGTLQMNGKLMALTNAKWSSPGKPGGKVDL